MFKNFYTRYFEQMPNVIITPRGSWLSFTPKSCVPSSWESETGHRTIIATLTMLLAIKFFFQAITVLFIFFFGGGSIFPLFWVFLGLVLVAGSGGRLKLLQLFEPRYWSLIVQALIFLYLGYGILFYLLDIFLKPLRELAWKGGNGILDLICPITQCHIPHHWCTKFIGTDFDHCWLKFLRCCFQKSEKERRKLQFLDEIFEFI